MPTMQFRAGAERHKKLIQANWQQAKAQVERRTGLTVPTQVEVVVCASAAQLRHCVPGAPKWAAAVAIPAYNRIVVNAADFLEPGQFARSTLTHELSHLALANAQKFTGQELFPKWFDEGLACWVSGRSHLGDLSKLDLAAALNHIPRLAELATTFPSRTRDVTLAYLTSERFVRYLAIRFGKDSIQSLLRQTLAMRSFVRAFKNVYHRPVEVAELAWRQELKHENPPLLTLLSRVNIFIVMTLLVIVAFVAVKIRNRHIRDSWDNDGFGF